MPVQINEVVIHVVVDNVSASTAPAGNAESNIAVINNNDEVAALVLDIIKEKKER